MAASFALNNVNYRLQRGWQPIAVPYSPMCEVRIDKWLWAARFFKTRALASHAIKNSRILVDGSRVKPARPVQIGSEIAIKGSTVDKTIVVQKLSATRGPAPQAAKLYIETDASILAREEARRNRRLHPDAPAPRQRPDKRARRHIIRFTRRQD